MQNMPERNIARHIKRCKPNPYKAWVDSANSILFLNAEGKKNFLCIICGYQNTARAEVIGHIKFCTNILRVVSIYTLYLGIQTFNLS